MKRLVRRKLRKHAPHESQGINIYPMMDMMTILLVFMVMQFAASTAAVVQETDELRLPYSTSSAALEDAVPIQITRNEVVVDGKRVLRLREGRIDANDKQGGANGMLVVALYREMGEIRDAKKLIASRNPNRPFLGNVQIIADQRTPYRTISEIVYTVGQTEFANLRFVVSRPGS
ncbi:MAG: biopolymer transporter ExbD [Polyangiaceae bacterium]|nr:biopolymer transporter ExbD [Polyangiaceae bacterium]